MAFVLCLPSSETTVLICKNRLKRIERTKQSSETLRLAGDAAIAATTNAEGTQLAVAFDNKTLEIWNTTEWTRVSARETSKRAMALKFHGGNLYVADKSGDVYRFSVGDSEHSGELILGHVSILLDLEVSPDGKYVISADRDEKLRVSHLPNAYSIKSFCLGHTKCVSQVKIHRLKPAFALSGSGDGFLGVWRYETGENCSMTSVLAESKEAVTTIACSSVSDLVAVSLNRHASVFLYDFCSRSNSLRRRGVAAVSAEVLHVAFDSSDKLWVLTANQKQPIAIIEYANEEIKLVATENYFGNLDVTVQDSTFFEDRPAIRNWNLLKKASAREESDV
ncbi:tRNA (guanine-N(7)-)-methyltransferase non-catalytic subunit wdr4-like [Oscarella lobularis]|uniref:tRNA (guanine-N(7)-)-methyltransferase non-catalytic subunit wdr4-like n=1 Tax=Oscarella lobularis TaxID=121494 RepID=UPI003313D1ED